MKGIPKIFLFTAILLTTTLFVSCKKETTTTRSVASLNGGGKCLIGRWPNVALPLTIKMSPEFTGDYNNSHLVGGLNPLEQMAQVWNTSVAPKILITTPFPVAAATGFAATNSFNDSEIGIYKSHTWFSNVKSALAITQFYGNIQETAGLGRHIGLTHADIIVNYRDYGSNITMTNHPMFEFDLPTIMLHEFGHLLGMCHQTEEDSIMNPYYITTRRSLEAYDVEHVNDIYVDGIISGLTTTNTNALSAPVGSKVSGVIELHADGKCVHYMNGKKTTEHQVDMSRRKK
jgi:predicted Zn-dependent protease